jgi:hypothetical protein
LAARSRKQKRITAAGVGARAASYFYNGVLRRKKPKIMPMVRRTKLILGTIIAATAIAAVAFFAASQGSTFYLVCNLANASEGPWRYDFRIDIPRFFGEPRISLTDVKKRLQLMKFDDTVLDAVIGLMHEGAEVLTREQFIAQFGQDPEPLAGLTRRGTRYDADLMHFRVNRSTGAALVEFYQKSSPSSDIMEIMPAFSESGSCSKSERVF